MKTTSDLQGLQDAASAAAERAAAFIRQAFRSRGGLQVRSKGHLDFVTEVDESCEAMLRKDLRKAAPGIGLIGEEGSRLAGEDDRCWLIDPLDGTSNFVHGYPAFAVSIGLVELDPADSPEGPGRFPELARARPLLGVIDEVCLQRQFLAHAGGGAWLVEQGERRRLRASSCSRVEEAFLASGFPVRQRDLSRLYSHLFARVLPRCGGLRRGGSAALDLAYTAAGIFDGFFEIHLSPWDIGAGLCLVEEAGGRCLGLDGKTPLASGDLLAGSGPLCERLAEILAL